jgi:predicted Rossmann fold flavoprotein
MTEVQNAGIEVLLQTEVTGIEKLDNGFITSLKDGNALVSKAVIIASGGHAKSASYDWLRKLGLPISEPIPSLFTFNVPDSPYKELMGISVPHAVVQIPASKWKQDGPLLITHWGFSAPAVIKLSAWAAIDLHRKNYQFPILINWCGKEEESVRTELNAYKLAHPKKLVRNQALFNIPGRLWEKIVSVAGIEDNQRYLDTSKKNMNRLLEMLIRHPFDVKGKTTFKEEFVTCGGVDLSEINLQTFESKSMPGLYLAGEVLNVDGVTGGFNFQHAWTSGYLAGISARRSIESESNNSSPKH